MNGTHNFISLSISLDWNLKSISIFDCYQLISIIGLSIDYAWKYEKSLRHSWARRPDCVTIPKSASLEAAVALKEKQIKVVKVWSNSMWPNS